MTNNNGKKTIGILGGAGPIAGTLLMKIIIEHCQKAYGCVNDDDYPKIILLSYPFKEMLNAKIRSQNDSIISRQLNEALDFLIANKARYIAIACNTLHGFLDRSVKQLVNLVTETQTYISKHQFKRVLVLCTNTSMQKDVFDFPTRTLLNKKDRSYINDLINVVLKGDFSLKDSLRLRDFIIDKAKEFSDLDAVLFGCTELSVLINEFPFDVPKIHLIDPLNILTIKICKLAFDGISDES